MKLSELLNNINCKESVIVYPFDGDKDLPEFYPEGFCISLGNHSPKHWLEAIDYLHKDFEVCEVFTSHENIAVKLYVSRHNPLAKYLDRTANSMAVLDALR